MEPHRRPSGRRVLLPAEAELCNALGLSEDDYWYFVELTEAYNGQRSDEYALIPDVRNAPVSIVLAVIGIALQAVSYLLAPKPAANQKTPPQLRTADIAGRSKFAPQANFGTVQSLASLGDVIPLIFTRKGVRVSGQLIWSQLLSSGISQQLKAIVLFGLGSMNTRPEFAGYAIGDMLLENYTNAKLALYFRGNGGRFDQGNRYSEGSLEVPVGDPFSIYWDSDNGYKPYFSGARNPSTQAQFGVYQPMPNGMSWRPNYELILKPDSADGDLKSDIDVKQNKIYRWVAPLRCYVKTVSSTEVTYWIDAFLDNGEGFQPWGTEDFRSAQESVKVDADAAIAPGELYMLGNGLGVCTKISDNRPWEEGITKVYTFKVTEAGPLEVNTFDQTLPPYEAHIIQRCAVATISNNQACNATEIGLKSTVWRQINGFSNVNSVPKDSTIRKYERQNGSISLGGLSTYISRLSFFRLEIRPLGSQAPWENLNKSAVFCIKGQTPQAQYNYIRINHPYGQYEFRLRPISGNNIWRNWFDRDVWQLIPGSTVSYRDGDFVVTFAGRRFPITYATTCNTEWIKGNPPPDPDGSVEAISSTTNNISPYTDWVFSNKEYNIIGSESDWYGVRNSGAEDEFYYKGYIGNAPRNTSLIKGDNRYTRGTQRDFGWYEIRRERRGLSPITFSGIVAAQGGSGSGLTINVLVYQNGSKSWSIANRGTGYKNGETVFIPQVNTSVFLTVADRAVLENNLNPYDAIADYIQYSAENSSHFDGPEHEVVYVNEMIEQPAAPYTNLAMAGICLNSSKEWSSFSELSAFFTRGVEVERLVGSPARDATNLLPEIAYALLTDPLIGAGSLIGSGQVSRERMTIAARFCEANQFHWDGVIAQRQNLREWIFENAGYCFLDFTILGGQFSLVPSVPYNSDFTINWNGKPEIKALFTDGNIRNLQVTFLSPEERQLFRATVLWRQDTPNGFPETRVLSIRLSNAEGGSDRDPEETFDMSGFCTTQQHAVYFAKLALKTRKLVDHGLKFETTPQAAMNLAPGEYFRLVSEATHTSRFQNGVITDDGTVQTVGSTALTNTPILYWEPGTTEVKEGLLTVVNGKTTQTTLFGTVFALRNTTTTSRVYKVESLSYSEEGLVQVAGSFVPLSDGTKNSVAGALAVLDWEPEDWVIEAG